MTVTPTPAFVQTPKVGWAVVATPDTETTSKMHDGTAALTTYLQVVFTAGTNGAYLESVQALPLGTNDAAVLRLWLNNGSTNTTSTNNVLLREVDLPATTISESASQSVTEVLLGVNIPAGYRVLAGVSVAASAGWHVSALGADY